jgi:hypothetical protein
MLGQLSGEEESDSCLNLSRGQCLLLVVSNELDGLLRDTVEDVVDERVHDSHGLLTDAGVGVDLLQDLEDVDTEVLSSLAAS